MLSLTLMVTLMLCYGDTDAAVPCCLPGLCGHAAVSHSPSLRSILLLSRCCALQGLAVAFAFMGFFMIPILPLVLENVAE